MNQKTLKRFYKTAGVTEGEGGFAVVLDGRPVRTPAGSPLRLPTMPLAEAVAAEWQAQDERVNPAAMPLTQLASTAIDRVPPHRAAIIDELLDFAATDLLCYRATEPHDLVELQARQWQPLLDWAMVRYDAPLRVTAGVMPVPQSEEALAALRRAVAALDDWRLTALQASTAALGSLVLGLALLEGQRDAEAAVAASQVDELYQIRLWGDDAEAAVRRQRLGLDVAAAARFAGHLDDRQP
jgi:chaperone required for assembly of F1-ATPase